MMKDIRYEGVQVVLVDQNLSMRRLMRSSLNTVGFQRVTECRNIENLLEVLAEEDVDLLILDLDTETERVCQEIKNIRSGNVGSNPFVVIIALTWLPEKDVVHLTLTSGTDDVVTKPVSTKVLIERVGNLVQNRKQFVVTTTYIGPERRTSDRQNENDLPSIDAPNTLRAKAVGDESATASRNRIAETMLMVKTQKVYRIANQIGTKTVILIERAEKFRNTPVPRERLHEISELVGALNEHVTSQNLEDYSGITTSMASVMENILNTVVPSPKQLEVLRIHSRAISASIIGDDSASQLITKALQATSELVNKQSAKVDKAS
jgi:DNA-binding response OmpR family regulator